MSSIGIMVHFQRKLKVHCTLEELKMSGVDNGNQRKLFAFTVGVFLWGDLDQD